MKLFEIRDAATFIPVMCIAIQPDRHKKEDYLLRRAGFGPDFRLIQVVWLENNKTSYDPYGWGGGRTLPEAHRYIEENWDQLKSGDVIDVEFILGETGVKKESERVSSPYA